MDYILLRQAFDQRAKDTDVANRLWTFQDELLIRSTQRDSANLAPADRTIVAPTDEEYDSYVDPVSLKSWKATPEDWTCRCCDRTKRQVIRLAKSGDWTGGVRHHDECIYAPGSLSRTHYPLTSRSRFGSMNFAIGLLPLRRREVSSVGNLPRLS